MIKGIEPDLFAALMRLSAPERADFLEFFGQSPVSAEECLRPGTSADWDTSDISREALTTPTV